MQTTLSGVLLCGGFVVGLSAAPISDFTERLTGDWRGVRTDWAETGVDVFFNYDAMFAGNVSGGVSEDSDYADNWFFGAKLDLDRLAGWAGTTFTVSAINRHGLGIDPAVGGVFSVMQIVGGDTLLLYNVLLEKTLKDGDVSLKLGRLASSEDFATSPLYAYSLNNVVNGQIRAVLLDNVMTSYPYAVWGGRVKAKLTDETDAQVGVYQISPSMFDPENHGVDFSIASEDGVSVVSQLDWHPELAGRRSHFFAGMNNTFFMDIPEFGASSGTTGQFNRFYAHGDIELFREGGSETEGLTGFVAAAYTWQDEVAIIPAQLTGGLHYVGLLPGRPADRTVLFATYGECSDAYSDAQVAAGGSSASHEIVIEFGHRIQIGKWAYAQPDVQFIRRPGGTGDIDDAVVVGVQFGAVF